MSITPKQVLDELPDVSGAVVLGILLCDRPVAERWLETVKALRAPDGLSLGCHVVQSPGQQKLTEIVAARTKIVETAVTNGAKYVFFLDDDVVPPADVLVKLHGALVDNSRARIAAGICRRCMLDGTLGEWLVGDGPWESSFLMPEVCWRGKVVSCTTIGAGAMLIDLTVIPELPKQIFDWGWVRVPTRQNINGYVPRKYGEDGWLCKLVQEAGYEVLAHGDVLCEHLDRQRTENGVALMSQL